MSPSAIQSALPTVMSCPDLYPFQVDWASRRILLAKVNSAFYRDAPFLDQRAFKQQPVAEWVGLDDIARHSTGSGKKPLRLMFHMGHCGSTLISRLLGDLHGVVSLREPLPLRDLATEWAEHTSPWAVRSASAQLKDWSLLRNLWCRTWTDDGTAIVKATSFCDLLAAEWLTQFSADTALLIHVSPETYLRSMFVHDGYLNDIY
ncbi:MAG: hypothetical protein AAGK23_05400, partial [Pseudomonadota bacterium]